MKANAIALGGSAALLAIAIPLSNSSRASAPELPKLAPPQNIAWLDQGWTAQQRDWFHHASQGTATLPIPYKWFLALERPELSLFESAGLFSDPAYLDRFGFIPSPRDPILNPDGLSVGFARTTAPDPTKAGATIDQVGFTCAACHTGRIDYRGRQIMIDGGPAMTDLGKFRESLGYTLGLTLLSAVRFKRFADRLLGSGHNLEERAKLKLALGRIVAAGIDQQLQNPNKKGSVEEGFGRLDALNRIGNEVFANQLGTSANYAPLTAPVAYPHIWDTAWYDWVQYNSSIEQPMVRNAGEAMGVRAIVNFGTAPTPRFTSTVPVDKLHEIEQSLAGRKQPQDDNEYTGLRAPSWPETILPRIDDDLADKGKALYERNCQGCHLPSVKSDEFWESPRWLPPNAAGERYLRLMTLPVTAIGTDPAQAVDMKARTVRVPTAFGLRDAVGTRGSDSIYPFGWALGQLVELVVDRWYDSRTPPTSPADRDRMNGFRPNGIRAGIPAPDGPPSYKARPLNGIWATAPYLHNGSVPTLYDLLSPYAERPKIFWLGNREFDPVKVGYVTGQIKGGFKLDTSKRGNWNTGHLFETPASTAQRRPGTIGPGLTPDERRALVEYLKRL